jgi:hypothetical protein
MPRQRRRRARTAGRIRSRNTTAIGQEVRNGPSESLGRFRFAVPARDSIIGSAARMTKRAGWISVVDWGVGFGLLTFSVLGALSIGVFILPVALSSLFFASRRSRAWPEAATGLLLGPAMVCLGVAFRSRNYVPCTPGPQRLFPGQSYSCGGWDPIPWLITGLCLLAVAFTIYGVWRRRPSEKIYREDREGRDEQHSVVSSRSS